MGSDIFGPKLGPQKSAKDPGAKTQGAPSCAIVVKDPPVDNVGHPLKPFGLTAV
jgi:hypothetical protein